MSMETHGVSRYEDFVRVHGLLLASAGIPADLHRQLFEKLSESIFDGGSFFEIEPCEGGRQRRLLLSCPEMAKHSNVFLVDHAWSFRLPEARKQLNEIPGLAERMATLMCVGDADDESQTLGKELVEKEQPRAEIAVGTIEAEAKERGKEVLWLELDDLGITDEVFIHLDVPSRFPNLVGLSLWGNKLQSSQVALGTVKRLHKLRALWLNENPIVKEIGDSLRDAIVSALPTLEIYNSKFTDNYTAWAVGFCLDVNDPESPMKTTLSHDPFVEIQSLDLSNRRLSSFPVKIFNSSSFPKLASLNLQGNQFVSEPYDSLVQTLRSLVSLRSLQVDIPGPFGSSAVTIVKLMPNLQEVNGVAVAKILERKSEVVDSNLRPRLPSFSSGEPPVEKVLQSMWLYVMTYRLSDDEKLDESPIWYVMDELGSALRHSDVPNFRVAPFMFLPDGTLKSAISYTLMWPTEDVKQGEECTRDFLDGVGEQQQRSARLTAWFHTPINFFKKAYDLHVQSLVSNTIQKLNVGENGHGQSISSWTGGMPISLYTDVPQVFEFLRRPEFVFGSKSSILLKLCGVFEVDDPDKAEILWTGAQIKSLGVDGYEPKPSQYINQFPFEACLVMKHHLAQTVKQAFGSPSWIQPTYNMESELAALIGDYNERELNRQDNLWIVKPWNMARTIDTTVTRNLSALIRLVETGPKICQKYIENPALFRGRKFDLRYIVLVRSIQPLEMFLSGVFWARFSNNQYTTEEQSLLEYETHFTVMNYRRIKLNHVNTSEFVPDFEKEHNVRWADIHERVKLILRSLFEGAARLHPDMHCPMARAIYGVDVMLDSAFQPKLLEVTFCPDCTRATTYDFTDFSTGEVIRGSEFFNSVFGCLFLNEVKHAEPL